MIQMGVQHLSIFGRDLAVALNTRDQRKALQLLTVIIRITFESLKANGIR